MQSLESQQVKDTHTVERPSESTLTLENFTFLKKDLVEAENKTLEILKLFSRGKIKHTDDLFSKKNEFKRLSFLLNWLNDDNETEARESLKSEELQFVQDFITKSSEASQLAEEKLNPTPVSFIDPKTKTPEPTPTVEPKKVLKDPRDLEMPLKTALETPKQKDPKPKTTPKKPQKQESEEDTFKQDLVKNTEKIKEALVKGSNYLNSQEKTLLNHAIKGMEKMLADLTNETRLSDREWNDLRKAYDDYLAGNNPLAVLIKKIENYEPLPSAESLSGELNSLSSRIKEITKTRHLSRNFWDQLKRMRIDIQDWQQHLERNGEITPKGLKNFKKTTQEINRALNFIEEKAVLKKAKPTVKVEVSPQNWVEMTQENYEKEVKKPLKTSLEIASEKLEKKDAKKENSQTLETPNIPKNSEPPQLPLSAKIVTKINELNIDQNEWERILTTKKITGDEASQVFILNNLKQLKLKLIRDEAEKKYEQKRKDTKWGPLGRAWKGKFKSYQVNKNERELAQNSFQLRDHAEELENLIHIAQVGPKLSFEAKGELVAEYLDQNTASQMGLSREEAARFNKRATSFAHQPKEYELKNLTREERKHYLEAKKLYEKEKEDLLNRLQNQQVNPEKILLLVNELDLKIGLHQTLIQHPEVEKELNKLEKNKTLDLLKDSFIQERTSRGTSVTGAQSALISSARTGLAFGIGYGTLATVGSFLSLPVVAASTGMLAGAYRARIKAEGSLIEKDRRAREGVTEENPKEKALEKKYTSAETLTLKLQKITEKLREARDKKEISRIKNLEYALRGCIFYTSRKLADDTIIFGNTRESLKKTYDLLRTLSKASVELETENFTLPRMIKNTAGESKLNRLDTHLKRDNEKTENERNKFIKKQIGWGSIIGALSGTTGYFIARPNEFLELFSSEIKGVTQESATQKLTEELINKTKHVPKPEATLPTKPNIPKSYETDFKPAKIEGFKPYSEGATRDPRIVAQELKEPGSYQYEAPKTYNEAPEGLTPGFTEHAERPLTLAEKINLNKDTKSVDFNNVLQNNETTEKTAELFTHYEVTKNPQTKTIYDIVMNTFNEDARYRELSDKEKVGIIYKFFVKHLLKLNNSDLEKIGVPDGELFDLKEGSSVNLSALFDKKASPIKDLLENTQDLSEEEMRKGYQFFASLENIKKQEASIDWTQMTEQKLDGLLAFLSPDSRE